MCYYSHSCATMKNRWQVQSEIRVKKIHASNRKIVVTRLVAKAFNFLIINRYDGGVNGPWFFLCCAVIWCWRNQRQLVWGGGLCSVEFPHGGLVLPLSGFSFASKF